LDQTIKFVTKIGSHVWVSY